MTQCTFLNGPGAADEYSRPQTRCAEADEGRAQRTCGAHTSPRLQRLLWGQQTPGAEASTRPMLPNEGQGTQKTYRKKAENPSGTQNHGKAPA